MSPVDFGKTVQASISALMREGERRGLDELDVPPPNKAERDAAAKYERKNSATPTPWQQHSDHLPFTIIGDCDVDNHYVPVATTDSDDANPAGVDAANARRIVTAVNAHDALVKAAQRCVAAIEALEGQTIEFGPAVELARARTQMLDVLAKVRP